MPDCELRPVGLAAGFTSLLQEASGLHARNSMARLCKRRSQASIAVAGAKQVRKKKKAKCVLGIFAWRMNTGVIDRGSSIVLASIIIACLALNIIFSTFDVIKYHK